MIHNNSKDPIYIKKINLNIWRLRDEVKSVIERRLELVKDPIELDLDDLSEEYHIKEDPSQSNMDEITNPDNLDSSEDEMAKALAEDSNEENIPEKPVKEVDETKDESEDNSSIIQRRPALKGGSLFKGRAILSEINMNHMYFFCNEEFLEGESIVLDFLIPNHFVLNAEVVFCRSYNMRSRIIGKNRLPNRLGIKFTFLKPGEKTLLRQFIMSIEPDIVEEVVVVKKQEDDEDDDGFGDLDSLDL